MRPGIGWASVNTVYVENELNIDRVTYITAAVKPALGCLASLSLCAPYLVKGNIIKPYRHLIRFSINAIFSQSWSCSEYHVQ